VNKLLFDKKDDDNDGKVSAATTDLDFKTVNCTADYYNASSNSEVSFETVDGNVVLEYAQAASADSIGVRVGNDMQHHYFQNLTDWETADNTTTGSRKWCTDHAATSGGCRVACLKNVDDTAVTSGAGEYADANITDCNALLKGSYYIDSNSGYDVAGGYRFGDAGQNSQKWVVVQATIGSDNSYYKRDCSGAANCAATWQSAGGSDGGITFCQTNDCNWVKVYDVAPGVDEADGNITAWWLENDDVSSLKHNVATTQQMATATGMADKIEDTGNVQREKVVVVTSSGDSVVDGATGSDPQGTSSQLAWESVCRTHYTGLRKNSSGQYDKTATGQYKKAWPTTYFSFPSNLGSYSEHLETSRMSTTSKTMLASQCKAKCDQADGCVGYYAYQVEPLWGSTPASYCSLIKTEKDSLLYDYIKLNRSDTAPSNDTGYQDGAELCLKV
jgi:hypothetical protein